jgi:hypothetical protein
MENLAIAKHKRSYFDRRGDQDRREHYDIAVVEHLGYDRRNPGNERRMTSELRNGWIRVSQWSSVCLDYISD